MRTKSFIPLLGFMLLLMAVSCSDPIAVNPNYNPETNEVTTKLVMNISTSNTPQTKQSAYAVQAEVTDGSTTTQSFFGITDGYLFTYSTGEGKILTADQKGTKLIELGSVVSTQHVGTTASGNQEKSNRILEMSLPLQTTNLLFYGRANTASWTEYITGKTKEELYGATNYNITNDIGGCNFQMVERLTEGTKFRIVQNFLAGILTSIINTTIPAATSFNATDVPESGMNPYKFDHTFSNSLSWKEYLGTVTSVNATTGQPTITPRTMSPIETSHELYLLEEKLANAYKEMTYIQTWNGEIRAGSINAIERTIEDLASTLNEIRAADPLNEAEAVAKYMAESIIDVIKEYFDGDFPKTNLPVTNLTIKSRSDAFYSQFITDNANRPSVTSPYTWPTIDQLNSLDYDKMVKPSAAADEAIKGFPIGFKIPRGASYMTFSWSTNDKDYFYYPNAFNTSGMGGATGSANGAFNAQDYFYPAELLYFGNSPIYTSATDRAVGDYPNGVGSTSHTDENNNTILEWHNPSAWTSWEGQTVTSSTRSVAMRYDINYGTALLKTQVQYATAGLKDNNHAMQMEKNPGFDWAHNPTVEPDKVITPTSSSFKLTGIIVGNQYRKIDWDFLPKAEDNGTYRMGFVYDSAIPETDKVIPASGPSNPVYTMLFDNLCGTRAANGGLWTAYQTTVSGDHDGQQKVYVALEFQNTTGEDFYGQYNLIRKDGFFYLIGELDPNKEGLTAIQWPTDGWYVLPPYDSNGGSQKITRVFMQDYMTSVIFKLGENSLKHAYLTVPDLRSGSISLGLSVDIQWSTGLVFDDIILGGN